MDLQNKIDSFFFQFEKKLYTKGEIIIHPDMHLGAFYLTQGFIRQYGISLDGTEVTIHNFTPHTFFPMTWIISDIPNRYYYEALTDVEGYMAPKDTILNFLKNEPEILFSLTQRLLFGLDKLTLRLEHMTFSNAGKRLNSILVYLGRQFGEEKDGKIFIKQKFSHKDIGALVGITRETASREIEKLRKEEIISYENHLITINDIEKLKQALM